MGGVIRRIVEIGVRPGQTASQVRRVQMINLIAAGSIFLNLLYNLILLTIGLSDLWLVFTTNTISIGVSFLVVTLNRRGRTEAAMVLAFFGALFNLGFAGYLLGLTTGVYLFLIGLPAVAILVTPPRATRLQLLSFGAGLAALLAIVLADPPTPASIAGTAFESFLFVVSIVGTVGWVSIMGMHFRHIAELAETALQQAHQESERLLHNILPVEIAHRLKSGEAVIADRVEEVSILFADLVGSTPLAERLSADQMVELLNEIFCPFDDLADELGIEKIKTVGDAYMVVGGLPVWRADHAEAVAEMALGMRQELLRHPVDGFGPLQMRFGIHTGSVVAGVIGKRKFSYDLWGDAVNTAARMESHGVPGEIQVTEDVYRRLKGTYRFHPRGRIDIKGKGPMETYFLQDHNGVPSD
jgi:guanylate cyclase